MTRLLILCAIALTGCETLPIRGSLSYTTQSGNVVTIGADGKGIVLTGDIRGFAK